MSDVAVQIHEPNRRLDAIDRKILMVLQEDASLSVAEIGDRVGLSSTPCWKRIQRLEADGVILRRVALVDQNKIGLGISVFVSVESSDHSEAWLKKFAEAVSAMPEVMEFYRMAGDVFQGAFALAVAEGESPPEALRFASAAAALKCTRFGGALAAPQRIEVEALLRRGNGGHTTPTP